MSIAMYATLGTAYAQEPQAASAQQELKAVFEDVKAHPDHWADHREDLINRYKKIGHDVAIDMASEFQTLLIGYSMFTAVPPPDSKRKALTPEQKEKALAAFVKRNNYSVIPFTKKKWKAAQNDQTDNLRYRLFKGFQRKHSVIGMQAEELMKELGTPAWSNKAEISYGMGPEIGLFSIDTMSLHFKVSSGTIAGFNYVQN